MTAILLPPIAHPILHTEEQEDAAPRRRRSRRMRNAVFLVLAMAVAFLIAGNVAMLALSTWAKQSAPASAIAAPGNIKNFTVVDDTVWRGAAPGTKGYRALAAAGVTTIVDLRAEENVHVDTDHLASLGLRLVAIPIRDGQIPSEEQVDRFVAAVRDSDGKVFLHCGAGVGRTGAMAASYLVRIGEATPAQALRRNLAVGPPSLEQVAFVADLDGHSVERPPAPLVAVSRVLDAPRRLWSRFGV